MAVTKAGYDTKYPDKMASNLVGNSRVQAALAKQSSKSSEANCLSLEDKRRGLHEIFTNPQEFTKDRLRALELDAKIAGHFAPDVSLQAHVQLDRDSLAAIALSSRQEARQIIEGQVKLLQVATDTPPLDTLPEAMPE